MPLAALWPDIDWSVVVAHLTYLGIAYALALPVGWDRERHSVGAGLRTFPLVAVGSCAYLLIGMSVLEGSDSHSRLFYGLMTGIGFIGGGARPRHPSCIAAALGGLLLEVVQLHDDASLGRRDVAHVDGPRG